MAIFLPHEKLVIETTLNSNEIKQKLSEVMEPKKMFRNLFSSERNEYEGEIDGDDFKINRIIGYRNSFLPIVQGKIQGSHIEITMRMRWFVEIFMVVWLGACAFSMFSNAFLKQVPAEKRFIPIGMFIFGYLLCMIPFKLEANGTKSFLQNLFRPSGLSKS